MQSIDQLIEATRLEAARAPFPVDTEVYEKAGKNPGEPVLYAGSLAARVAIMGRDLGKDEVAAGQPLIGAGGRLVRGGIYRAIHNAEPPAKDKGLESVLDHVLLTNTVPFKPPGNKAYPDKVKERFRPLVASLLVEHFTGRKILTLGTEAFRWYSCYAADGVFDEFWARADRYEADLDCTIRVDTPDGTRTKVVTISPLPHPSPLNQRWYKLFPGLLARRLATALTGPGTG
ncbi:uracil-DNA glycosylase family protein [Isosphaeraceae bacterium EP7]